MSSRWSLRWPSSGCVIWPIFSSSVICSTQRLDLRIVGRVRLRFGRDGSRTPEPRKSSREQPRTESREKDFRPASSSFVIRVPRLADKNWVETSILPCFGRLRQLCERRELRQLAVEPAGCAGLSCGSLTRPGQTVKLFPEASVAVGPSRRIGRWRKGVIHDGTTTISRRSGLSMRCALATSTASTDKSPAGRKSTSPMPTSAASTSAASRT